jgi:hypothetical protein
MQESHNISFKPRCVFFSQNESIFYIFFSFLLDDRSPIASAEAEMTLKQFGSITELLTKLRADLRQSFQR